MKLSEKIDQAHNEIARISNILTLLVENSSEFEYLPTLCTLQLMANDVVTLLDEES